MTQQNVKTAIIIDEMLPTGIIANTAAILGISLGKHLTALIGDDVSDANQYMHSGIITIPVPILKGNEDILKNLRKKLYEEKYSDLLVIDFSDVAQKCQVYSEYIASAANTTEDKYNYYGIAIYGPKKQVTSLTGSLALLR